MIAELVRVKRRVEQARPGFWPYHFPEVAASAELIDRAEAALKREFPPSYRQFLLYANGWSGFFQTVDLLSCEQLLDSPHRACFEAQYGGLESADWQALGLSPDDLMVIGATLEDRDAFVLNFARASDREREVVWLAGDVVDRWSSFHELFLSMIEYNRSEVQPAG